MILVLCGRGRGRAAHPHRLPGDRDAVLDRDRDSGQPQASPVGPSVDLRGLPGGLRLPDPYERTQLRIELRNPVQMLGDHLGRRDYARPDPVRDLGGGTTHPFSHDHIIVLARPLGQIRAPRPGLAGGPAASRWRC